MGKYSFRSYFFLLEVFFFAGDFAALFFVLTADDFTALFFVLTVDDFTASFRTPRRGAAALTFASAAAFFASYLARMPSRTHLAQAGRPSL
jgi:hypothetical protein